MALAVTFGVLALSLAGTEWWLRRGVGDEPADPPGESATNRVHVAATVPGLAYELGRDRRTNYRGIEVVTNSRGLRDDEPRSPRAPRVFAALGDSLTFGWGLAAHDTWPEALQREIDATAPCEVDNYGVSGYTTRDEAAVLLHKVADGTRGVVLAYFLNDPLPDAASPMHPYFRPPVWWRRSMLWRRHERSVMRDGMRANGGNIYRYLHDPAGEPWHEWLTSLDELEHAARERGIPVLVVLMPTFHGFTSFAEYPYADLNARVATAFRSRGFTVLDLVPAFARNGAPPTDVRVDDEHPNAEGHRIVAHAVAERIRELGWLDGASR